MLNKNHITRVAGLLLASLAVMCIVTSTFAATKEELKERFIARAPAIRAAKNAEKIGEVWSGLLELRYPDQSQNDSDVQELVRAENSDRQELYKIIAEEEGTTAQLVAERAGKRNFERAQKGDWLKYKDGQWRKKE